MGHLYVHLPEILSRSTNVTKWLPIKTHPLYQGEKVSGDLKIRVKAVKER
jgi:hypothetical protein